MWMEKHHRKERRVGWWFLGPATWGWKLVLNNDWKRFRFVSPKIENIGPGVIPNSVWGTMQAKKICAQPFQTRNPSRTWIRTFQTDRILPKTFSIIYTANTSYVRTGLHLSSVTTTTHTSTSAGTSATATATGSPREPSRNPVPPSATRSFSTRSGTSRLEPCLDPRNPWNLLGTLPGTCPKTFPEPCSGTLPRNLPRTTAPEPILAKTP